MNNSPAAMASAPEAAAQRWEATGMLASATDSMVQGPYAAMAASLLTS